MSKFIHSAFVAFLLVLSAGCAQAPATSDALQPAAKPPVAESTIAAEVSPSATPLTGLAFPYVTQHKGVFNGQRVAYTATVGAVKIKDADGNPGASIVSTSYVAEMLPGLPHRPVMFVFNGGPISSSVYLHMGAFGPRRVLYGSDWPVCLLAAPNYRTVHDAAADFVNTMGAEAAADIFGGNAQRFYKISQIHQGRSH